MKDQDILTVLFELPGHFICKVQRILYVLKGEVAAENGPIEITFTGGPTVLLDAAPDGEALAVRPSAWTDPFADPLSVENREFVERSGKWTAFDVSEQVPYSHLIAEQVSEVIPVRTLDNKIKGATIKTAHCAIHVEIEADEVSVDVG
jgi:hypothetical protein